MDSRMGDNINGPSLTPAMRHAAVLLEQDVLTVLAFVKAHDYTPEQIYLVGLKGAGHWAAAANYAAGKALDRAFTYYSIWSSNLSTPEFREISTRMAPKISESGSVFALSRS